MSLDALKRMVDDGTLVCAADFQARMGWSEAELDEALQAARLFCLSNDGQRFVPAMFLDAGLERRTLTAVVRALGSLGPGSKLQFFESPKLSLGGLTPVEAIRAGTRHAVVVAAQSYANR